MSEELKIVYGVSKLKRYARHHNITVKEAYDKFKKMGADIGWNERDPSLLREFDMKHALAGMMFREIPDEEKKRLTEEAIEAGKPEAKRELLKEENFKTQFLKLPEMEKLYDNIKHRKKRYIRTTLRGVFRVCQELTKFFGRPILPVDLVDPDTAKTLITDFLDKRKEEYIDEKIKPIAEKTGEPIEVVYRDMAFHSAWARMPIRALEEAHGRSPLISGEKDPTKARILRMKELDTEELVAEEIVERLTKDDFKTLLKYFDDNYPKKPDEKQPLDALEFKGLAGFLAGTATRIGMTRITGALSIKIADVQFDRDPIIVEVFEKETKAKGKHIWKKLLPPFSKLHVLAYLEARYKTSEWAKVRKERGRDYLFPRKYQDYRVIFRKAFDEIGLTGITHPFHCFRHSWVDWMIETPLGDNPLACAKLGGWDDVSTMINRYFGGAEALLDKWYRKAELKVE